MKILGLLFVCLLVSVPVLNGSEMMRMQLSPAVARAPALLTVRVSYERADDDRYLQVVAESQDFYRSSQIQLEGKNAAPLKVFEFRNLPSGVYEVTGFLIGANGMRATVARLAKVEPSLGSR